MPSKYKPKTNRKFRSPSDVLEKASKQVSQDGMSYRVAAANFDIDKMTLMRYMKKKKLDPNCGLHSFKFAKANFFTRNGTRLSKTYCFLWQTCILASLQINAKNWLSNLLSKTSYKFQNLGMTTEKQVSSGGSVLNNDITCLSESQSPRHLVVLLHSINTLSLNILATWLMCLISINLQLIVCLTSTKLE